MASQSCAAAFGTRDEGHGAVDKLAYSFLHRLAIFAQNRLFHPGDKALVGVVEAAELGLCRLLIEQRVFLFFGECIDGLVCRIQPCFRESLPHPGAHFVAGDEEGAVVKR